MTAERLYLLGLFVRRSAEGVEVDLPFDGVDLQNPVTGTPLERATFTLLGDRLVALEPPEMVGMPPVSLTDFDTAGQLRNWMVADFKRMLSELDKRGAELRALGLDPQIDPGSLRMTALLDNGVVQLEVAADRRGNLLLARAAQDGVELPVPMNVGFDPSEFSSAQALFHHLCERAGIDVYGGSATPGGTADYGEPPPPHSADDPHAYEAPEAHDASIRHAAYAEAPASEADHNDPPAQPMLPAGTVSLPMLYGAFGPAALLPPQGPLELVVELQVRGQTYRFAAARVQGTEFRGLLVGQEGRVWSNHFDLASFGGLTALVAEQLQAAPEDVHYPHGPVGEGW